MATSPFSSFQAQRGTNISHWLSQSQRRGSARREWFTRADMDRIAAWGFDHIRLPVDEVQLWDDNGCQDSEGFDLLDSALDWADAAGLNVIVDLHILRSHFFTLDREQTLFTDPAEAERFAGLWRQLSARLQTRSAAKVAYELMNEPVARDAADWNRVARCAFQAVRALEPERKILLGSNYFNSVTTFDLLDVPEDGDTILTFHYYLPMLVTHHQAGWCWEGRLYAGPIQYPGNPVPADVLAQQENSLRRQLEPINAPYGRDQMAADLAKPFQVARRTGLPLYCGEFGVINKAPFAVREAWYKDIVSVFEEHGIGWANWDYKGDFGIVTREGESTGVAEALLGTK
jgi:endoglucanase